MIRKYLIGTGLLNIIDFNYNTYNKKFTRFDKENRLLLSDRFVYSIFAFGLGSLTIPLKILNYIDYSHIKYNNENPEDYGFNEIKDKPYYYL
jgi:hypothetical protein